VNSWSQTLHPRPSADDCLSFAERCNQPHSSWPQCPQWVESGRSGISVLAAISDPFPPIVSLLCRKEFNVSPVEHDRSLDTFGKLDDGL
jgi:hypothetical protein